MDGFVEKFSQRFSSAQEQINANGEAEATQVEKLQSEVRNLLDTLDEKMGEMGNAGEQSLDTGKLESHIHKENVRVYRNVQAAVTDELEKRTGELKDELETRSSELKDEFEKQTELISAMLETLNEQQKSQGEALSNMAMKVNDMENSVKKAGKGKAVLPLQIIIMILLLGDIAFNVLMMLGIL